MSPKHLKSLLFTICGASIAMAAAGDNVSVYSGGLSLGGTAMLNDSSNRAERGYGMIGFNNKYTVTDNIDIFGDLEWYGFTSGSFGAFAGMNGNFGTGKVRPFVGAGGGISWYDHGGDDFDKGFGLAAKVQGGVQFDVTDNMGISFAVPFRYTFNEARDNSIGFQVGMNFFSAQRKIKKIM